MSATGKRNTSLYLDIPAPRIPPPRMMTYCLPPFTPITPTSFISQVKTIVVSFSNIPSAPKTGCANNKAINTANLSFAYLSLESTVDTDLTLEPPPVTAAGSTTRGIMSPAVMLHQKAVSLTDLTLSTQSLVDL